VTGGVADDELAFLGGEVAVGDVDGDALLALGGKPVGQQRQIDLARARDAGNVVLQHGAAIDQEAPNQRALAVVHAAAGDEAQGGVVVVLGCGACWISVSSYGIDSVRVH